jgi:hypothetical protein
MLNNNSDLGAALFKTWTEKQRSDEIEKLVKGFRNGVPIGIFCKMVETVAGDKKTAKKYIKMHMTLDERTIAVGSVSDGMQPLIKSFML